MRLIASLLVCAALVAAGDLSGRRAPGFSLPDLRQQEHDLADYRGKVVLLDVIRTNCPHCAAFADHLEILHAKYAGKVAVLSIVMPPDTIETVSKFAADHHVTTPLLFDCGQVAVSYFKATPKNPAITLPHVFLIDGEGMIRDDYRYDIDTHAIFEGDGLAPLIDRMLTVKPKK